MQNTPFVAIGEAAEELNQEQLKSKRRDRLLLLCKWKKSEKREKIV